MSEKVELLIEAMIEKMGYRVEYSEEQKLPSGQITVPARADLYLTCIDRPIPVSNDAWSAIVGYVISHEDDIRRDMEDFGELRPVLDFFNRNS